MKITSPPEVVEAACAAAGLAAFACIIDEDAHGIDPSASVAEMRARFPHLDSASLVLISDYIAATAATLVGRIDRGRMTGRDALRGLAYVQVAMVVEFGNDLVDDLEADAEEALSGLRAKLTGDVSPQHAGDVQEARLAAERERELLSEIGPQPEADAA